MEKIKSTRSVIKPVSWIFVAYISVLFFAPTINSTVGESEPIVETPEFPPTETRIAAKEADPVEPVRKNSVQCSKEHQAASWMTTIIKASERHQVDPALIKAIIMAESGFNPNAISKKGAIGLMQLMPRTAEELGVADSFDPNDNIHAGVEYFGMLLNRFNGDVNLALAAYNAGSRRVRQYNGVPPFKATQYYIKKVLAYYDLYKEQADTEADPFIIFGTKSASKALL